MHGGARDVVLVGVPGAVGVTRNERLGGAEEHAAAVIGERATQMRRDPCRAATFSQVGQSDRCRGSAGRVARRARQSARIGAIDVELPTAEAGGIVWADAVLVVSGEAAAPGEACVASGHE